MVKPVVLAMSHSSLTGEAGIELSELVGLPFWISIYGHTNKFVIISLEVQRAIRPINDAIYFTLRDTK